MHVVTRPIEYVVCHVTCQQLHDDCQPKCPAIDALLLQ